MVSPRGVMRLVSHAAVLLRVADLGIVSWCAAAAHRGRGIRGLARLALGHLLFDVCHILVSFTHLPIGPGERRQFARCDTLAAESAMDIGPRQLLLAAEAEVFSEAHATCRHGPSVGLED